MTSDNIKTVFAAKIKGDLIELPDKSIVEVDTFANLFADSPDNPTHADLMLVDNDEMGYKLFFDQCKVDGILV